MRTDRGLYFRVKPADAKLNNRFFPKRWRVIQANFTLDHLIDSKKSSIIIELKCDWKSSAAAFLIGFICF